MNNLPNKRHSDLLHVLCEDLELADPYRTKFPNKNEYSYIPSDPIKKNRSRLDFFVISRSILNKVTNTSILPGLQNKLFDHCAIVLEIAKKKTSYYTAYNFQKNIKRSGN
jgi:exonuclease III